MARARFATRLLERCAVAAFLGFLAACGGGGGGGGGGDSGEPVRTVTTVTVSSPAASPTVGETVQLTVVARDQFGDVLAGKPATWSTSDVQVATISATGLLQAVAPGAVVATATIDGLPGSLTLTVLPGAVASVTISSPTSTPKEGDSVQLTATALDPFGNVIPATTATWSSSDMSIATVSTTGLVRTISTGAVAVTASVGGVAGTQSLTITPITVSVALTIGAKEVVFRYATDRCDDLDTPDHPPRLVRAEDGSLALAAGNAPRNYLSRGADFNSLRRDCRQAALASADRRTAESYENWEWLWSVYREGSRWHALIHNEFHDTVSSTCLVGDPSPGNPCGFVSITHALSIDGGLSFTKPSAPAHVVAPAPKVWVPPAQAGTSIGYGYMSPTNIVRGDGGYYYALVGFYPDVPQPDGRSLCVMRTGTLDDPASWRAWDGSGFALRMTSPYVTGNPAPWCRLLNTEMGTGHVVYSTYLERYLLVTRAQQWIDGRIACGFFFTLSSDLIHWSRPQLLVEGKLSDWAGCDGDLQGPDVLDDLAIGYPSVVDHTDATVNFERAGRTAHLYYVRSRDAFDRDVVRVPITFRRAD
jgi:Bacterial Ig-like domain (group 2)